MPRSALHDGHVYLVDGEKRLERRAVTFEFFQSDFASVKDGLEGGESLVLSDLVPAMDGMLLAPVADPEALEALVADAAGKTTVR